MGEEAESVCLKVSWINDFPHFALPSEAMHTMQVLQSVFSWLITFKAVCMRTAWSSADSFFQLPDIRNGLTQYNLELEQRRPMVPMVTLGRDISASAHTHLVC